MSGTTTLTNLPYPTATDPVSQGAAAIQSLADTLDPRVPFATAVGSASASFSATTQASVAVTFPAGRFTQAPLVFMSIQGAGTSNVYAIRMAGGASTSGFTVVVNTAAAYTGTVSVGWHAIQQTK